MVSIMLRYQRLVTTKGSCDCLHMSILYSRDLEGGNARLPGSRAYSVGHLSDFDTVRQMRPEQCPINPSPKLAHYLIALHVNVQCNAPAINSNREVKRRQHSNYAKRVGD